MTHYPVCNSPIECSILQVEDLVLEVATGRCWRGGFPISLTKREVQALSYMMRNRDKQLTRTDIVNGAWGSEYLGLTNKVDVYINYLRNKIDTPQFRPLIHTVRYVGYLFGVECESKTHALPRSNT